MHDIQPGSDILAWVCVGVSVSVIRVGTRRRRPCRTPASQGLRVASGQRLAYREEDRISPPQPPVGVQDVNMHSSDAAPRTTTLKVQLGRTERRTAAEDGRCIATARPRSVERETRQCEPALSSLRGRSVGACRCVALQQRQADANRS